ncbi:hypothetical protein RclHR1_00390033 [Rhizophagus clarus]|uniref:G-protein coupled receptors family 1 profile domain-containing protein n=1 Tax=Rhizophagus clarus TaxID=94130 RepID=A0A2Z6S8D9_9GLOM|nr:hypothetical protein RclHR1_00390033 [Rhizophagus clarus]
MDLQPSSFRIILFISSFLYIIPKNNAFQINQSYDAKTEFYVAMVIPLTFLSLNLLGTFYIFYRTYLRWKYECKVISLSHRFPFYIAITDFLYSSTELINYSYPASNKSKFLNKEAITWPSPVCEIIGFYVVIFVCLNVFLVGAISITTWLRVVQEYYYELGKYDYKIWLPIIFLSLIFPLSAINSYGAQKYRYVTCLIMYYASNDQPRDIQYLQLLLYLSCGTKVGQNAMAALFFIIVILTLLTIIFCYIHILRTIHNIKEDNSSTASSHSNLIHLNNIERKTLKKVLTYILVFILQYVPILIYNVFKFLKIQNLVINTIASSVICFGGMGNVIQYICNEGLSYRSSSVIISLDYKSDADEQQSNDDSTITNV